MAKRKECPECGKKFSDGEVYFHHKLSGSCKTVYGNPVVHINTLPIEHLN